MSKTSIKSSIIKKFYETRIQNQQDLFFHPSFNLEQQLMSSIMKCDEKGAREVLNKINQLDRAKLAEDPVRSYKNSMICSCTLFTRAVIRGGVLPEDAFNLSDIYIQQIEKLSDMKELFLLEYEMVETFIDRLKNESKLSYNSVVNKAILFIHQEILNELILAKISEHVGVHPSYLSKVFKKSVGVSISEFITRKRVEESKYFLLHSTSSLSDISLLFGFCNQSYYSALFKKYTGITPKQFRDTYPLGEEANE
ncbi:AraC family transcriptional regulator [Bacillus sp. CGMCC 1.16607]|uniref:AraC family transcriptional regulator n=1 Tax=Bacillus sp. CGMCC 1.16607 TaxID=3351842 RepID=UPI00362F0DCE